jgi:KTSC domain
MLREAVDSESIASIGYADDAEVLEVEFVNGAVYRYRGVPQDLYEDLRQAPSKGAFFNHNIRDAYPYEQVA